MAGDLATPEQRAALRRAYVTTGDPALAELAAALDEARASHEVLADLRAMTTASQREVALLAEVAALRAVAEAARGLLRLERPFYCDCDTLSAGPCAPCRRAPELRAALRAWEECSRG